jgi:hypothetical protein
VHDVRVIGARSESASPSGYTPDTIEKSISKGTELMGDLVLPAFEMDCREWMVVSPSEAGLPEDVSGAPLLAVLSTAVIEDDIREATGALTVGLIDEDEELDVRQVAPGAVAHELLDEEGVPGTRRYVMPAPGEHNLALLAEFVVGADLDEELDRRVEALMTSFRWQAA